jgi:plastocyanin
MQNSKNVSAPNRRATESPIVARIAGAFAMLGLSCWLGLVPGVALAHGPTIKISHDELKPALLNLYVGTTVHFSNTVEMPGGHVVVEKEGRIESPPLEHPGDGWHYTFEEEGVFEVFIRQHPEAQARIVVVPKPVTPGR